MLFKLVQVKGGDVPELREKIGGVGQDFAFEAGDVCRGHEVCEHLVEEVGEAQAPGEEAREIEVAETVPAFFPSGGLHGAVEDFHLIERTGGKFGLPVRRGVPALNSLIKRHEARQEP